jgi:predicted nuclease of predicted toxin-antitoxin system
LLPEIFSGSSHIKSVGLINAPDKEIWEYAKKNDFIIVTQDSDFIELNLLFGFPPKIIWIRTGNLKTHAILEILTDNYYEIEKFVEDENFGCFEILRMLKK